MQQGNSIPTEYLNLTEQEMDKRIRQAKAALGAKLVILGHHYQKDQVIRYADYRGDSLKLAQLAAEQDEAEYIVFCGVHFMAETADILSSPEQKVILPDLNAGCSMADMADISQVLICWNEVCAKYDQEVIPITYVNSSAEIKAFCGRHGGMTCTSSNAERVMASVLQEDKIILFLPDQHLGCNTARKLGVQAQEILLWDPDNYKIELPERPPRLILWDGFCCVHQMFQAKNVWDVKAKYQGIKIIVHPECEQAVVADFCGSTEYIIRTVTGSLPGSIWAVGTEFNLVNRLAEENPDKKIISLNEKLSLCRSMNRIGQPHLLWILENLKEGNVVNQIVVDPKIAEEAKLALNRMLEIS